MNVKYLGFGVSGFGFRAPSHVLKPSTACSVLMVADPKTPPSPLSKQPQATQPNADLEAEILCLGSKKANV